MLGVGEYRNRQCLLRSPSACGPRLSVAPGGHLLEGAQVVAIVGGFDLCGEHAHTGAVIGVRLGRVDPGNCTLDAGLVASCRVSVALD